MKRILVAAMALVSGCSPAADKQVAQTPSSPCDVAAAYLDAMLLESRNTKFIFANDEEQVGTLSVNGEWYGEGTNQRVPGPDPARFTAAASKLSSVGACPAVRQKLDRYGVAYGEKAVAAAIADTGDGEGYRATILNFSLPLISRDGTEAIVATSSVSAPEGGAGSLRHLKRRSDGRWEAVSESGLWIS
ncbi:hypothetical protein [Sphingomonas sp. G-3-2-10]|uniref:hypothetical protein n=1 Tax=Sphingomonas sp. G-3-2-10 TaxID=2728838 RepID=UPI00146D890D|nr:hypothetical protein [Sphingomonas sp. G-3-2-10]NML06088.1 hypothetical protein [Sphingomonas sp. G-3-2-10]